METKKCSFCAEEIKQEAIKCRFCGENIKPFNVKEGVWICIKCKEENEDNYDNCWNCGADKTGVLSEEDYNEFISQKKNVQKADTSPVKNRNNRLIVWSVILIIFLFFTLSFHYIPSRKMMFPKNNLTFSYTIITENDIQDFITRYNKAIEPEKSSIGNEPVVRKLIQKGIIVYKTQPDINNLLDY